MSRVRRISMLAAVGLALWAGAAVAAEPALVVYPQHYAEKVFGDKAPALTDAQKWAAERKLSTFAARGEYESLSVVIFPPNGLQGVQAVMSDLKSTAGKTIPAADLRWVKCWWQPKGCYVIYDPNARFYGPRLLVKDPKWIVSDTARKHSSLVSSNLPTEPKDLQPVDIAKGCVQQLWITVHVPDTADAGTYQGTLTVSAGAQKAALPVSVEVPGWTLLPPAKEVSLYTAARGGLSESIHLAQDRDMKEHGLTAGYMEEVPPDYEKNQLGALKDRLRLYTQAGLLRDDFMLLATTGIGVWNEKPDAKFLADSQARTRALMELIRKDGYKGDVYVYGADEWAGKELEGASQTYRAIQAAGAKVFCACGDDYYRYAGKSLDLPIMQTPQVKLTERALAAVARSHADGSDVWSYVPFTTMSEPMTFRYRLGFWHWMAPIEGTCLWAYMDGANADMYENFPTKGDWMHSMLAYPTANGVISTIGWEGFREGVDDMRYATTLLCMVIEADRLGVKGEAIEAARKLATGITVADDDRVRNLPPTRWCDGLDPAAFDAKRKEIATAITQLAAAFPKLAPDQIAARSGLLKDARNYLKKQYPALKGAFPYGVTAFPELQKQLQASSAAAKWYDAVQAGWKMIHAIDKARADGKLDDVQYGALIDAFVDDFHEAEINFVRVMGPDKKNIPGEIGKVFDRVMEMDGLEWKFKADWQNVGNTEKWFAPEVAETDWRKIDVTKCWEQQGYDDLLELDGAGWYRVHFKAPAAGKGKRVFVCIGGADEYATIWLNGKLMGGHPGYGGAGARPFQIEITDGLRFDGDNVMTVRIFDTMQAGGLWKGLEQLGEWQGIRLAVLKTP